MAGKRIMEMCLLTFLLEMLNFTFVEARKLFNICTKTFVGG